VPVFWTYEPSGTDARVFVSIFGHYRWTFDDPFFRLILLRGMSWAAKETPYRLDQLALEGLKLAGIPPPGPTAASRIITPPAAMWPEYLEDSVPPVVNIGPASPTTAADRDGPRSGGGGVN
jgi:hypothetical protein